MLLAGEKQAPCPAGGPGFVLQCSPRLRLCFASRGVQRFPWVHAPPPVLHWCGPALSPPGGGGPTFAVPGSIFPTTHASHRGAVKRTSQPRCTWGRAGLGGGARPPTPGPGRAAGSRPAPRSGAGAPPRAARARSLRCAGPSGRRARPQTSDVVAVPDSGPRGAA